MHIFHAMLHIRTAFSIFRAGSRLSMMHRLKNLVWCRLCDPALALHMRAGRSYVMTFDQYIQRADAIRCQQAWRLPAALLQMWWNVDLFMNAWIQLLTLKTNARKTNEPDVLRLNLADTISHLYISKMNRELSICHLDVSRLNLKSQVQLRRHNRN